MPPTDEPGRRSRAPRHGGPDPRWGGPGEADQADDPYGDVTADRVRPGGRHGTPDDGSGYGEHRGAPAGYEDRFGVPGRDDLPDGDRSAPAWPPATALPSGPPRDRFADGVPESRFGTGPDGGRGPAGSPTYGPAPLSPPYGQAAPGSPTPPPPGYPSPPRGVPGPTGRPQDGGQYGDGRAGPGQHGSSRTGPGRYGDGPVQAGPPRDGQAGQTGQGQYGSGHTGPGRYGNGQAGPGQYGNGQTGPGQYGSGQTGPGQYGNGQAGAGQYGNGQAGVGQYGNGQTGPGQYGSGQTGPGRYGDQTGSGRYGNGQAGPGQYGNGQAGPGQYGNGQTGPGQDGSGQTGPGRYGDQTGSGRYAADAPSDGRAPQGQASFGSAARGAGEAAPGAVRSAESDEAAPSGSRDVPLLAGGIPPPGTSGDGSAAEQSSDVTETTGLGPDTGKHRRGGALTGPGRDDDDAGTSSGPGRRSRSKGGTGKDGTGTDGKKKRKGSFWRELPLLVVVAIVLTFVIQTFVARIYVIPSASMEQTLHGCTGCANDRVAVDKVSYRFGDPSPGDVVVFKGPPAWLDNDEVSDTTPSGNAIVRGFQDALSLVGLAAPNEKDFVKRVIAVGGQTVACCDASNRVLVDGKPLTEPYLYYQDGLGTQQATFDPVRVPEGQLWVMGDNRNNSADARFHGPVPLDDVIGKVRVVVLPVTRWRTVPAIDPQTTTTALGPEQGLPAGVPPVAGALLAVPVVWSGRRLRQAFVPVTGTAPPEPGPAGRRGAPPQ